VLQNDLQRLRNELEISTRDIDQQDTHGYTPLYLAVFRHSFECLEILLEYGADPRLPDKIGFHVLNELLLQKTVRSETAAGTRSLSAVVD
jgi:ankyrin repeat protein